MQPYKFIHTHKSRDAKKYTYSHIVVVLKFFLIYFIFSLCRYFLKYLYLQEASRHEQVMKPLGINQAQQWQHPQSPVEPASFVN